MRNTNHGENNNPYSNTTANSAKLYKLDATNNTVQDKNGLGIILKVMVGDVINIFGKSYHKMPGGGYSSATNPLSVLDLMNLLVASPQVSGKGISGTQISGLPGFPANVTSLLNNQPPQSSTMPRASINWVILDEQFKYVSGGFDMVGTAGNTNGTFKDHAISGIAIPKNGYIYVYCSNESQYSVFFDNVQVVHDRGPVLEETHYYPFGLTMAGISSRAAGTIQNKEKTFQDQRFDDELGLNWIQFKWRNHDVQIGRFIEIDPLAEEYVYNGTYAFSENKVTNHVELEGLEAVSAGSSSTAAESGDNPTSKGGLLQGVKDGITGTFSNLVNAIAHPVETAKAVVNNIIEHPVDFALDKMSMGFYGKGKQLYNDAKKNGLSYAIGKTTGANVAQTTIALGTAGAGKAIVALKPAKGGGRVFWSGGDDVMKVATDYAKNTGQTTLGMTRAGQNLQNLIATKNILWPEARLMWARLSTVYAKGAKGSVDFFGAENAGSIWMQFEKPILIQNGVKIISH